VRTTRDDEDEASYDGHRKAEARRRIGTLAFFGILAVATAVAVATAGREPVQAPRTGTQTSVAPSTSPLRAGTYRLPGVSTPVALTLPEGWYAGDSVWGPAGQGLAAVSTGRPGATIGIAAFDLGRLLPFPVGADEPLDRAGDDPWFRRWLRDYRSHVRPRVRNRVVGRQLHWRPPPVLAWLLAHTDRGLIDVADDIVYEGIRGDLASFSFPGPRRRIFAIPGAGVIALRPGITYTFWVPGSAEPVAEGFMLGVARELGAAPSTEEWDIVRTIDLGG